MNQAVFHFGSAVTNEIESVKVGKNDSAEQITARRTRVLRQMLSLESGDQTGQFRDPAAKFK